MSLSIGIPIRRANDFFEEAKGCLDKDRYALACFNAQQAAELYLKATLISLTETHIFIHSLVELLEAIDSLGVEIPEKLYTVAEALEAHYIKARYPTKHAKRYTKRDSERCIKYAEQVIRYAKKIIEEKG